MRNHEHIVYIKLAEGEEDEDEEKENTKSIIKTRESGGGKEENNESIIRMEFKQFDIILKADAKNKSTNDDHFYASSSSSSSNHNQQTKYSSQTTKRIMKEWKILEDSLPDSIYVRAYEGRVDLLRAVIIGASGTPYHDGLFFFDIQFPLDYPNVSPNVHYHSFGLQLNPSLCFKTGNVCLSLLDKTVGPKNEHWNPSESTILQLLVSIQGLVFCENPYYNEPANGYLAPKWFFGDVSSSSYNEDVFLLSCRTMLAVLNRPPSHFEEFVAQHFRDRAETILIASKAYIDGRVKIGDRPIENTKSSSTSRKFKHLMSGIIYSKLVNAFKKNGSSLEIYTTDEYKPSKNKIPPFPEPNPIATVYFTLISSLLIFFFYCIFLIIRVLRGVAPFAPLA